jgi:hypothetical protein
MKLIKLVSLSILSCGWLAPLWAAYGSYIQFLQSEQSPERVNSFPFLSFSKEMFSAACAWLAVAIAVWSVLLGRKLLQEKRLPKVH